MKDKFLDTPAGDMWLAFKKYPSVDVARRLVKEMQEFDRAKSEEIEMQ